jgi:hypothetical protein
MLKIKNILSSDDKRINELKKVNAKVPYGLPKLHFNMLVLGARNSGKTNIILNMLLYYYKGIFDDIFIFSPTFHTDAKWKSINIPNDEKIFDKYSDDDLQSIIDFQREEENLNNNVLIIFDDCVGQFNKKSLINHFITRTRHENISCIFSVQYTKGLSPTIRANLTSIVVFNNVKKEEVSKIKEIIHSDFEKYMNILKGKSKYNFIFMNGDAGDDIKINFDNMIVDDQGNDVEKVESHRDPYTHDVNISVVDI